MTKALTRDNLHGQIIDQCDMMNMNCDVISDGPVNAEIAVVGEGLGESEVRNGVTFCGTSGNMLWNNLRRYGISRANCYVTNTVKRQISLSRKGNERHAVYRDELQRWQGILQWELSQLPNLRFILCLGNYALEALTGNTGITNWRGSVIPIKLWPEGTGTTPKEVKACITINPAYALREPKMEPMFLMDCHKMGRLYKGTFTEHKVDSIITENAREAMAVLRDLNKSTKPISYDIEVINMETACYGLGNDAHRAACIPLRNKYENLFTPSEEVDFLNELQAVCDSHKLIAQNGSFDAYWTRLKDMVSINVWFDTLLAHHTLYPQLPHSLAFLTSQYTTHPYYKDEGKFWREGGDINQFWRYNCTDVALTYAIHQHLTRELKQQGLEDFFFNHVMRAQPHLVSATVHGVAVDVKAKERITEEVGEDVEKLKARFYALAQELTDDPDYYPNPGSWQQLQGLLYDRLKLKGRGRGTDANARENLLKEPTTSAGARELLSILNRYAEENKFYGTYAKSRLGPDNRFRCEYKQYGTQKAPGRLSSAALLDGQGGNMQNQPYRARGMYVADKGCVFCYFDLSQAEARVVAVRADIETWKEQFEKARLDGQFDCHRALASDMFKIPYDEVPKDDIDEDGKPTLRFISKRCRHGLNYRMQRHTLAQTTGLPFIDASRAFALYHSETPELQDWWERQVNAFRRSREIWNALGRRWKVIQRLNDDVMDSVIAFYPQSTIGDKITQVWYQAEEDDDWPIHARVAIDVHDNLVAIAEERHAKTVLRILKKYAESPIFIQSIYGGKPEPLIVPAELKISTGLTKDGKPDEFHRWNMLKAVEL